MYLESIQLQGFKSFAQKTTLKFLPPTEKSRGITAIVGPNGSGKSNCVDAFRWVLGEQSIKTLRGKKTEDVIFAGSNKKQRSGFAEVTVILKNEGPKNQKTEKQKNRNVDDYLNLENIEITRRVYRDGASDYYLNKNKVRLADIHLLLAKIGLGTRSYGIIGQGMIDSILIMNDAEKKEFFDEATGIKQYQLKRNQALLQLKNASNNMNGALTIINEIEPHLRYLKRQVNRLEEKTKIEEELHSLQHIYYSALYHDLIDKIDGEKNKIKKLSNELNNKKSDLQIIEKKLNEAQYLDARSPVSDLQENYRKLLEERSKFVEKELQLKNKIWQLSQRSQKTKSIPINAPDIILKVENIQKLEQQISEMLNNKTVDIPLAAKKLKEALEETRELIVFLKKHNVSDSINTKKEEEELTALKKHIESAEGKISNLKKQIEEAYKREEEGKKDFIHLQKNIQSKREEVYLLENKLTEHKIELAKLETKKETLEKEMREELKERIETIKKEILKPEEPLDDIYQEMQKKKYKIALAGGVDSQVVDEYKETNERYTFLKDQTDDLKKSIENLKTIIDDLDETMESQFSKSFGKINEAFGKYFKILFGGGSASLNKKEIKAPTEKDENENLEQQAVEAKEQEIMDIVSSTKYTIEIDAAPPGKKIKGLQMLSGGERALTAIALVCGIIHNNPSPFIILDEVDAALDETNSIRFADILKELTKQSQFVIITHNRATMENSSLLYGVTMGDDGTSKILSVDLRDAEKMVR